MQGKAADIQQLVEAIRDSSSDSDAIQQIAQAVAATPLERYPFGRDDEHYLLVPDYDPDEPEAYPGDIQPGYYSRQAVAGLLLEHRANPEAVYFIADMLEE